MMQHPYFKQHPFPLTKRKDRVTVCFGEEVRPSQRGKISINSDPVVRLTNNKLALLETLDAAGLSVPGPIHGLKEFFKNDEFDAGRFDEVFQFPVQARRRDHTVHIENYRDLMEFILQKRGNDYAIHGLPAQFKRFHITMCNTIRETVVKTPFGMIHQGIVSSTIKVTPEIVKLTRDVYKAVPFDMGTIELIQGEGEYEPLAVENISLAPNEKLVHLIEAAISAKLANR